jgi:hypothetical protein
LLGKEEFMIKLKAMASDWNEFVPEFMGNRELPKKEQISCKIKFISQAEQDKLTDSLIGQQRDGFRKKNDIKWSKAHATLVNEHIKEIKNVFMHNGEKDVAIETMAELYKIPQLKNLYTELASSLEATLTEEELKN